MPNAPSSSRELSQNRAVSALARHGLAWALSRDEPEAALQAIDHYLEMLGGITTNGIAGAALGLAGGLRGRLGDPVGAVEALRGGVVASRDEGARPQVAATLEWSISVLIQVGRTEAAAVCMGALTAGALAAVSKYPSMFAGAVRERWTGSVRRSATRPRPGWSTRARR